VPSHTSKASDQRIRRSSSGEQAAAYLRRLIFEGELRPGKRIPQEEVAQTLGISRIPVREALIALEREGWLTIELHRGAFINALDEQSVRDHYDLFGVLYGFAAERAVERDRAGLAARLDAITPTLTTTEDPAEFNRLTLEFHAFVIESADSPRIVTVLRSLTGIIPGNFFELVPGAMGVERKGAAEVARAVRRGDGPAAAVAYQRTMQRQGAKVVQLLRSRGLFDPAT
jgi:DNA-binding GntR family transcriptional regulator